MPLRHAQEIQDFNIPSCPPTDYTDNMIENVFRFSADGVISENTFRTPYELNKDRMPPQQEIRKRMPFSCDLLALSFYRTEQEAKNAYSKFKAEIPKFKMKFLITGTIQCGDGKSSCPDDNGHFNHHPYITTNYQGFNIVCQL